MFWKYLMCPKAVCIWQKYSKNNNSVKYYIWCLMILQKIILIWKWKWHDVTYSQVWWPILGIRALHLTHPKCTHTAVNTHTHTHIHIPWTHTRSSGQLFMLRRPGSSWGFVPCSRAPQSWYWGWRERCTFTPPPTIPAGPRLELATFRLQVRLSNPLVSNSIPGGPQLCTDLL